MPATSEAATGILVPKELLDGNDHERELLVNEIRSDAERELDSG